ncbi:MAG: glucosaminidase domain-containing protein [Clostridiales bacterium]|nr:glucosaminidase domain-containing protein [Clostridiales bacterium]MCF8022758.1 glucosaminidase domain-containing protein [Clostridiales bacterium]
MVPVRFVSESLGAKVSWNENTKTVLISFDKLTKEQDKSNNTPIISSAKIGVKQAQQWAKSRGASDVFIELAELYWELVDSHGGVNPAGAYAQAAKETGFGKFNGVVSENYKNPCGMKIHEGGANNDPGAHQKFNTWEDGVAAHLDHLALYAGAPGYPKNVTTDPRHFSVIKGRASSFEELGGNWAPSGEYGESLVKRYLNPLLYPEN